MALRSHSKTSVIQAPTNLPSAGVIFHGEKRSKLSKKCHPAFGVWLVDFNDTEYSLPGSLSYWISCRVWYPLEMKPGISDLPNTSQELWEWFLPLITTHYSRPNEGWALKEINADLSCSYRGFHRISVFADRSKLRLSRQVLITLPKPQSNARKEPFFGGVLTPPAESHRQTNTSRIQQTNSSDFLKRKEGFWCVF